MSFWTYSCVCCHSLTEKSPDTAPKRKVFFENLCQKCSLEIWQLRLPWDTRNGQNLIPKGLFRYDRTVKDLIWRAKIRDDHRALSTILHLGKVPAALDQANWADVIIPAPSSFWGRLRGRLDVGAHFADYLGELAKKNVFPAPLHLHWRLKKNAGKSALDRKLTTTHPLIRHIEKESIEHWHKQLQKKCPGAKKLLIIDDIVTTGATFEGIVWSILKSFRAHNSLPIIRTLAFAQATN